MLKKLSRSEQMNEGKMRFRKESKMQRQAIYGLTPAYILRVKTSGA